MVNFLLDNAYATQVELRGNNISERGILQLCRLLRLTKSIRQLSLEWNLIGASERAVQALCEAMAD